VRNGEKFLLMPESSLVIIGSAIEYLTHPPAASEREGDWQPIETAPRDQFLLLAAEFDGPGDWRIKMGEFRTKVSDYGWHIMGASWAPTRWMPLPADPDAQRLGREKE
jgi:hypothetical protein